MSDEQWFMARLTVLKTSPGGWTAKAVVIRREEVTPEPTPFAMTDDEDEGVTPKSITLKKTAVFEHADREVARSNAMNWLMENT